MKENSFLKHLYQHASKYLTGSVISAGTTLLMMKYYTHVFSTTEFGILALYMVMFQYIIILVSLNMDSGATRFYFDYRKKRRDEYLSTIFWVITFFSIIVLFLGLMLMDTLSNLISPDSELLYVITIISGIAAVYVSFLMRVLFNEHKSSSVLKHTVFQSFMNHMTSVLFISVWNLGILGRISGQGTGYLSNLFSLLNGFYKNNLFKLKLQFNFLMAKETFLLAIPGAITALQNILFVYLDRFFIQHYIGNSEVGIYTLGYMLGQGLSLVYEAISQAIFPKVYTDMNENYEKARVALESFSYKYYIGLVILTVIISLLSPIIVALFSNDNYADASFVMPFVMAGFMMGGFYKIPSIVLGYHKKVWFYPFIALFSFGVNALLNWYLIPIYGIVGAAFASFIGLFLYSIMIQIFSFKYLSKRYKIIVIILYLLIFSILFVSFLFIKGGI